MEAAKSLTKRRYFSRILILVLFFIAATIAIIVAIVMHLKAALSEDLDASVLLPLYIYPTMGAWDPLYSVLRTNPNLDFYVVVNPANGPGTGPAPDKNYTRELTKLNAHANVKTFGYVSTSYGKRDLALVLQDVERYRNWNSTIGVKGIFFDETPSQYSSEVATFLGNIDAAVRISSTGFGMDPLVIHNPGVIPDYRYMGASGADITIVFEATYTAFKQSGVHEAISSLHANRSRLACLVHSVPASLNITDITSLVIELKYLAASLFVTDQDTDLYTGFGKLWPSFIQGIAE